MSIDLVSVRAGVAAFCLGLAACGGGGGDAPDPSPQPPPTGNAPLPPGALATCGLADFQSTAMARINQWRASGADCGSEGRFGPASALAWNNLLAQAATGHSQDMATLDFFSHTGSNGSTAAQRITAAGYAWRSMGENIAAGQQSVNQVVDGWIASPGHCANLLDPGFTQVGLACVPGGAGNTYPTYWTMELARPG